MKDIGALGTQLPQEVPGLRHLRGPVWQACLDLGLAGLGWTVLRGEASLLPAKGTAHLWEVSAGCGWRWGGPQGAEGQ